MITPTIPADAETVLPVLVEYLSRRPGYCGGKPQIAEHRIEEQHIAVWHERMGMTAEKMVATYPKLTQPAVYAVLACYHAHRAEIDADIAADERLVAKMIALTGPSKLRQRPGELRAKDDLIPPG